MTTKYISFNDKKIQKSDFYKNKKACQIDDVDVHKILVSKKEPYGTINALKYFIGYNHNDVIRPLCFRLLQMTGYPKKINENVTIKPVYGDDDKYIKTKIKNICGEYDYKFS